MIDQNDLLHLNNRIVALETKSDYLERDVRDHKESVEKQFEKLNGRFDKMDVKIDRVVEAVTNNKISIAKVFTVGSLCAILAGGVISAIVKYAM